MGQALASKLTVIKERSGISGRDVAQLLGTTPQTVSRWQTGRATPQPGKLEGLLVLEWLADRLSQFYEPEEARLWLYSPHRLLNGQRPADLIADGCTDDVLVLLDQLESGAFH